MAYFMPDVKLAMGFGSATIRSDSTRHKCRTNGQLCVWRMKIVPYTSISFIARALFLRKNNATTSKQYCLCLKWKNVKSVSPSQLPSQHSNPHALSVPHPSTVSFQPLRSTQNLNICCNVTIHHSGVMEMLAAVFLLLRKATSPSMRGLWW